MQYDLLAALAKISLVDAFDILLIAVIIYLLLIFIKQTRAYAVLYIAVVLAVIFYAAQRFNLRMVEAIIEPLIIVLLVAAVVVFQRSILKFLKKSSTVGRGLLTKKQTSSSLDIVKKITEAVVKLSELKHGAIMIIAGKIDLDEIVDGGFVLEGNITIPLLMSIFDPTSPGHDGALIIEDNRIKKFGVHLPLAFKNDKLPSSGTRHRAGVGITEMADCVSLVVSGETGRISYAKDGKLNYIGDHKQLEESVNSSIKHGEEDKDYINVWRFLLVKHFVYKIIALVLALALWVVLFGG